MGCSHNDNCWLRRHGAQNLGRSAGRQFVFISWSFSDCAARARHSVQLLHVLQPHAGQDEAAEEETSCGGCPAAPQTAEVPAQPAEAGTCGPLRYTV